jgi:hypothetical protein
MRWRVRHWGEEEKRRGGAAEKRGEEGKEKNRKWSHLAMHLRPFFGWQILCSECMQLPKDPSMAEVTSPTKEYSGPRFPLDHGAARRVAGKIVSAPSPAASRTCIMGKFAWGGRWTLAFLSNEMGACLTSASKNQELGSPQGQGSTGEIERLNLLL